MGAPTKPDTAFEELEIGQLTEAQACAAAGHDADPVFDGEEGGDGEVGHCYGLDLAQGVICLGGELGDFCSLRGQREVKVV